MEKTKSPGSHPNFYMYSAHDSTVAANLETVGLWNYIAPPYASTVIYELHQKKGDYYVNVRGQIATGLPF